jgi:hypothetical protein
MELKQFQSRQDFVNAYTFPTGKKDDVGTCWFMLPLEAQLSRFDRGLGRVTYFKTIERDLEKMPFEPELESLENQKPVMYQMITDYALVNEYVHPDDCTCGCEEKNRASLLKLDGFDDCYLGISESYGEQPALIYDYNQIIEQLKQEGMSEEEAQEFYEFNIIGSYIGEKMPIFLIRVPLQDLNES